jgi:hypothetical protein
MSEKTVSTLTPQHLVNAGMFIQFHLAALGHIVIWLWMFVDRYDPHFGSGGEPGISEIFLYTGIPISFGVLVAVYILFRCLLAYANFGTALITMITIDVLHAIVMCFTIITPARLVIPIVLYSIAYRNICPPQENMEASGV